MSHHSDEEQVELLKRLWKDHGQSALTGLALGLAVIFGYQYWEKSQAEQVAAASSLYQNVINIETSSNGQLNDEQRATVKHLVSTLQQDFASSKYAALATLFLVKHQVNQADLKAAQDSLNWVLKQNADVDMKVLVSMRLARILLAESNDNAQKALDVLAGLKSDSYTTDIALIQGAAYEVLGKKDEAKAAYQKALDSASAERRDRGIIQLKLDNLSVVTTVKAVAPAKKVETTTTETADSTSTTKIENSNEG